MINSSFIESIVVLVLVSCSACRATYELIRFSGDSDVAAMGFISANLVSSPSAVVIHTTAEEWTELAHDDFERVKARTSPIMGSKPYSFPNFLRKSSDGVNAKGLSFQEYRKNRKKTKAIYKCACCGSDAVEKSTSSSRDFIDRGGEIIFIDEHNDVRRIN